MTITRDDTLLTPEMINRYTADGHWTNLTLADVFRRNAQELPDKVAYIDDRSEITWGALWKISGEVAAGLARRGVRRGDVVAVQLPNRLEFVYVLAAVARLGAVFLQFPPDYRAREIEFILGFSEAQTVVVPDRFRDFDHVAMIEGIRARLPKLVNVVVARTGHALEELRDDREPAPDAPSDANDVMRIAFTSGTTGDPKAVMHTSNSTLFSIQKEIEERGVGPDSTLLVLLPVGLNAGFFSVVETALAGARAVLMERFQAAVALDLVTRYRVTNFIAAPSAILAILADDRLAARDLSSLRVVQTGGASTPVKVLREANERLGCPVLDVYGMLETGLTSCTSQERPLEEIGTVGRPYPWLRVRILDVNDRDVPIGTEGEIVKTGPTMMVGYYRNPTKNRESWTSDGWFRSGDRGYFDSAGRLTISGRSKDMIIHGGANIWPRELEEVVGKHPSVADVAVVGIHDDYFGENVCACVVPRRGASLTLEELVTFMKYDIAKYKLPQRLELFEAFPLGPTGKVLKRELAETIEKRRGTS